MDDFTLERGLVSLVRGAKEDDEGVDAQALLASLRQRLFGAQSAEPVNVGRFKILRRLGQGGMGVVYEAYDPKLHRHVAIKLLTHGFAQASAGEALLHEARSIAQLSHPHVVSVHEVGQHGSEIFVAMEFIDGESLHEWQSKPRTWKQVVDVYRQAAQGLAAAHRARIVHGDFKPHNVLIGQDGRVRVVDFGLARAAHRSEYDEGSETARPITEENKAVLQATSDTPIAAIGGTAGYMAPELLDGELPSPASDQYAFCVSLRQALSSSSIPFAATQPAVEQASTSFKLRRSGRKIPAFLSRVIARGLQANPRDRFENMEALLEALARDPAKMRRRFALGAGIAGLFAGAIGVPHWQHAQRLQACRHAGADIAQAWSPERKAKLRDAYVHSKNPLAAPTWPILEHALDDYVKQWGQEAQRVCETITAADGAPTPIAENQKDCLTQRRLEFTALVQALLERGGDSSFHGPSAVSMMLPARVCQNTGLHGNQRFVSTDPDTQRRAEILHADIIRAETLRHLGDQEAAAELLDDIATRADALGDGPAQADALTLKSTILLELNGNAEEASKAAQLAVETALRHGHESGFVRAASQMMFIDSVRGKQERSKLWRSLTDAALQRRGAADAGIEAAYYFNDLGSMLSNQGEYTQAVDYFEKSLALKEHFWGEASLERTKSLNNIGVAQESLGDFKAAADTYRQAILDTEKATGETHPFVALALANLGNVLALDGESDIALPPLQRAAEMTTQISGPKHPWLGVFQTGICRAYLNADALEDADAACRLARKLTEDGFGKQSQYHAEALYLSARAKRKQNQAEQAAQWSKNAIEILEVGDEGKSPRLAEAQFEWAQALVAAHGRSEIVDATKAARAAMETFQRVGHGWLDQANEVAAWMAAQSSSARVHTP